MAAVGGAGATAPTGSGAERGGVVSLWVSSKKKSNVAGGADRKKKKTKLTHMGSAVAEA